MRIYRRFLALAAVGLMVGLMVETPARAATFNVRDFGATGNGSTNDTPAIQRAIDAAANAGGANIVQFPSGTYRSANSIHMRSNITIQLDSGATILGSPNDDYDPPESNPFDDFQDFGHSHFHNAMIWGDRLTNIGFVGSGTIDGGDNLITGNPASGEADKIISLTRCNGLRVDGITLRRGGHFAMLTNNCNNITSDRLRIDTASDRDGWNIISATNVTVTNANISANDDALAFKSDYALGAKLPNGNVRVFDSRLSAVCCNALMFGSETCGDFTGYDFQRITINGSNKSGLGLVSMDGAVISDVHYKDITMTNVRAAITQKIGTRRRCGNSPGVGSIHHITYENITSSGQSSSNFTATLWGETAAANRIHDITFTNVDIDVPGGNACMGTGVPSNNATDYNPNSIGTRPAYGWYIHNANNIRFQGGSSVGFVSNDCRPAVIANAGSTIEFDGFAFERGSNSPADFVFQSINPYCVRNSGSPRITSTSSTAQCGPVEPPPGRFEAENAPAVCDGTIDSNWAGFSGTGFCNTTNAVGAFTEWTVTSASTGPATLTFGWANGTTTDRPSTVSVNGVNVATPTFGSTGTWTDWTRTAVNATLNAGSNVVRVTGTTANGAPNLDYVDVAGPAPTEIQAEACTISQGVVESNHAGFTGTGFVNGDNVAGSFIECTAPVAATSLVVRYANGTTTARPMDVSIDGVNVGTLTGVPTGAWTTWIDGTIATSIAAGSLIRLTATTANGGPNLDRITIS
ncbi:MAG TPA: glycosyl hydrolase family 28 protein [Candidatus Limnocylindrales bacterium]|nr:glycosyl hydrolase family 28 protein [Candidatus Limnocylindrales bacterium]